MAKASRKSSVPVAAPVEKKDDKAAIFEALDKSQAVIEFNMDGTIITANDNFQRVMGYRLDEIQGRHHGMFAEESLKSR